MYNNIYKMINKFLKILFIITNFSVNKVMYSLNVKSYDDNYIKLRMVEKDYGIRFSVSRYSRN